MPERTVPDGHDAGAPKCVGRGGGASALSATGTRRSFSGTSHSSSGLGSDEEARWHTARLPEFEALNALLELAPLAPCPNSSAAAAVCASVEDRSANAPRLAVATKCVASLQSAPRSCLRAIAGSVVLLSPTIA